MILNSKIARPKHSWEQIMRKETICIWLQWWTKTICGEQVPFDLHILFLPECSVGSLQDSHDSDQIRDSHGR